MVHVCLRNTAEKTISSACRRSRRKERKHSVFLVVFTGRARFIDIGIACQARNVQWHAYACYLSPTRFKSLSHASANKILLKLYLKNSRAHYVKIRSLETWWKIFADSKTPVEVLHSANMKKPSGKVECLFEVPYYLIIKFNHKIVTRRDWLYKEMTAGRQS